MEEMMGGSVGEADGGVSVHPKQYLRNRLTPAEAEQFAEQGWLLVENALPADQCWLLEELVRAMHDAKMVAGRAPHETIVQAAFSPANALQDHEATMNLLKAERVLPKVVDILGANIKCYHSHWNYTPGRGEPEPDYDELPTLGFHQDSHRVNIEMGHEQPDGPRPRLSVKCAYFLTDCSASGRANTWIVPGSHRLDTLPSVPGGRGQPAGAMPVLAPANSCLIFDRRLWHTASPNWSAEPRMVCFVGYSPRWMKARDAMWVEPSIERTSCPVVRQLLGATTTMAGLYGGNRHDMPLRHWLHTIGADTGLGMNLKIADDWGSRGMGEVPSGGLDGDRGHATHPRCPERVNTLPLGPEVGNYSFPALADSTNNDETAAAADSVPDQPQLQLEPAPGIDLDADSYLANRLSPAERTQFEDQGYLIIENALPADQHSALIAAVDEARAESIATGQNTESEMTHAAAFSPVNNLQQHDAVTRVLTNERILPKVIDILGFNICCYHYHVNVTPPPPGAAATVADAADAVAAAAESGTGAGGADAAADVPDAQDISAKVQTFRFHQDSGQPTDMEAEDYSGEREPPQFSLKCGYILTDCEAAGMANTWIIPRQHKYDDFDSLKPLDGIGQPRGAIPVCCKANSCLIFVSPFPCLT